MNKQGKNRQTGCPVTYGLDTFGDRWSLLVIRDMMLHGKNTYGEFLNADEHISTNILADRLKHLEAEGIIEKLQDPENRRSFIYTLTEKGYDLAPVILETIRWSGKHIQLNKERKALLARIETDREGLLADIRAGSC